MDDPVPFHMSAARSGSWNIMDSDGTPMPCHVWHPMDLTKLPAQLSTYSDRGPLQIKFIAVLVAMRVASAEAGATSILYPSTQYEPPPPVNSVAPHGVAMW